MSMRDSHVLHAVDILGDIPLRTLAQGLVDACDEAEAEGIADVGKDPAVSVFGAFIAFHTHCDLMSPSDYRAAVDKCIERHNSPQIVQ
jgi:hypothetical protein